MSVFSHGFLRSIDQQPQRSGGSLPCHDFIARRSTGSRARTTPPGPAPSIDTIRPGPAAAAIAGREAGRTGASRPQGPGSAPMVKNRSSAGGAGRLSAQPSLAAGTAIIARSVSPPATLTKVDQAIGPVAAGR